jgi:hypothetical protein
MLHISYMPHLYPTAPHAPQPQHWLPSAPRWIQAGYHLSAHTLNYPILPFPATENNQSSYFHWCAQSAHAGVQLGYATLCSITAKVNQSR